jgi:hypothetical protein
MLLRLVRFVPVALVVWLALPCGVPAQDKAKGKRSFVGRGNPKKEAAFIKSHPKVGDTLPSVTVYTPDGQPFNTGDLRGHYTVLTFGCLT